MIKKDLLCIWFRIRNKVTFGHDVEIVKKDIFEGNNYIGSDSIFRDSYIGKFSYLGMNCYFLYTKIGRFTSIGNNVRIIAGEHPINKFITTSPIFYTARHKKYFKESFVEDDKFEELKFLESGYFCEIGNDVWIGDNVLIKSGIKIGDGAVIGAGAVVTKNIEPYSINVGVPAKKIKSRYSEDIIKKLLDLKWWDKGVEFLRENAHFFDDINNIDIIRNLSDAKR